MLPFLLVPGLNCDARVYAGVARVLWQHGPITIANHTGGDRMEAIAAAILADAPPRFALAGFSMGGYLAFEILRQAPARVQKLCLLDTSAAPDAPEATETRRRRIALAEGGRFGAVVEQSFPLSVHPDNVTNPDLYSIHRAMAEANGPQVYVAQQQAIIRRPDSRGDLAGIGVPTLIVVGEGDQITPPAAAAEMHAGIAGSRLATIARAGHLALLEQPEPVHAALAEWAAQ
jgi:pimeloyl-ACP methyl ester carboxylesterase